MRYKRFGKFVIAGGSNNAGTGGGATSRRGQTGLRERGASGAEPPTLRIFLQFFLKKYAFLSIIWYKFLLKTRFDMTAKSVLMRPHLPPLLRHYQYSPPSIPSYRPALKGTILPPCSFLNCYLFYYI